jgi:hypothetical protein
MRKTVLAAVVAFAFPLAAQADGHGHHGLSGEEISALVSGNTVEGSMMESGPYAEFYAADGAIKGAGYAGEWMIEGDTMCFSYDGESAGCWNVVMDDDMLNWVMDGQVAGDGMVMPGNTNDF